MGRYALLDRAEIVRAYKAGESPTSIMARLGCSRTGLYWALDKAGVARLRPPARSYVCWTARQQSEMARLYAAGLSLRDIGDRLGKPWTAIAAKRKALKLKRPDAVQRMHASRAHKKVWTEAQERSLRQLFFARYRYADIGKMLGRSKCAITTRVAFLGLKRRRGGPKQVLEAA